MAARHIRPVLGAMPVDTLTRRNVAAWLNGMAGAAKTKKKGVIGRNVCMARACPGAQGRDRPPQPCWIPLPSSQLKPRS